MARARRRQNPHWLITRYRGRCHKCGASFPAGTRIYWEGPRRSVCQTCMDSPPAPARPGRPVKSSRPTESAPVDLCDNPWLGFQRCPDGVWRYEFASVTDMMEMACRRDWCVDGRNAHQDTRIRGYSWEWRNGFAAPEAVREAWRGGADHIRAAVASIKAEIESDLALPVRQRRRVCRRLDVGDELDALAVLYRQADGWSEVRPVAMPARRACLGVDLWIRWDRAADELLYRGAAAVALADLLTDAGVAVEIVAFSAGSGMSAKQAHSVTKCVLKHSDAPLDVGAVGFLLGEIAAYRLVWVMANSKLCHGRRFERGATVDRLGPADRAGLDVLLDSGVLSRESAVSAVRAALASWEGSSP